MSSEAMKWARQQRFGTVPLTALVNAIAARADKHGTVWAAQETLAADIGSTARYVRKLLAKAERLGIMNRKYRSGGARGRLTDTMTLEMHKAFRLTASDVRKAVATGTRVPLAAGSRYRNKTHVATGTRVPGINEGIISYPSHGVDTYQDKGLGPARLAVVAGTDLSAGGAR